MRRILTVAMGLLAATSAFSSNSSSRHPAHKIATTARIVRINAKTRTLVVSGSDGTAVHHLAVQKERPSQRIVFQLPGITFPGSIMIPLPGGSPKPPQSTPNIEHRDEYIVLTTGDTLFQDGSDCIPFEDFKTGETISIHGELKGTILTASRLAKWN